MKDQKWIPQANEIVSWGCDTVKVISSNFCGKVSVKMLQQDGNGEIVKDIDISELQQIA